MTVSVKGSCHPFNSEWLLTKWFFLILPDDYFFGNPEFFNDLGDEFDEWDPEMFDDLFSGEIEEEEPPQPPQLPQKKGSKLS